MSSSSGSARTSSDDNETTPLHGNLEQSDFDTASETSEAYSYRLSKTPTAELISSMNQYACGLGRLTRFLVPGFLQNLFVHSQNAGQEKIHPSAYLDGMRGLAAFAVFLCHLSYSTWDISHVYGAAHPGEKSQNKWLLQLPIVRLFYSGPPMVAIFFVISGYALSYKPLKQMRNQDYEGFIRTLTSAAFRRPLRLFLPCFVSTFVIVSLARLGLYKMTEDFANNMRAIHEGHYWTAPDIVTQLCDWMGQMLDFINVFDWGLYAGSIGIDPHLWTIPVEFRCSMALFITQVFVARMSTRLRMATISLLMIWGTYWNRWEMVPFWAGILIAEMDLIKLARNELPCSEKEQLSNLQSSCRSLWRKPIYSAVFVLGLFLASYPDAEGHLTPGYVLLTTLIPQRYTEKHRFWSTIGAILIVWSVSNLQSLKNIFNSRVIQYLGQISFPLYVCHGFVIHTFGYMMMDWIWTVTDAWDNRSKFEKGYAVAAACTIVMTVWVSDCFLRVVDTRCVRFSRWLEQKVFVS